MKDEINYTKAETIMLFMLIIGFFIFNGAVIPVLISHVKDSGVHWHKSQVPFDEERQKEFRQLVIDVSILKERIKLPRNNNDPGVD